MTLLITLLRELSKFGAELFWPYKARVLHVDFSKASDHTKFCFQLQQGARHVILLELLHGRGLGRVVDPLILLLDVTCHSKEFDLHHISLVVTCSDPFYVTRGLVPH